MGKRMSILAFAALGLIATATFGYRAAAQNAEQNSAQADQQGKMMMQCPMMEAFKSVPLYVDTPAVLLGQAEPLELTEQQQEKLKEIVAASRQQAREVLTDEQRQQLDEAPSGPLSPMQLAKIQKKDEAGESKGQMCPMCMKMMQQMKQRQGDDQAEPAGQR